MKFALTHPIKISVAQLKLRALKVVLAIYPAEKYNDVRSDVKFLANGHFFCSRQLTTAATDVIE